MKPDAFDPNHLMTAFGEALQASLNVEEDLRSQLRLLTQTLEELQVCNDRMEAILAELKGKA